MKTFSTKKKNFKLKELLTRLLRWLLKEVLKEFFHFITTSPEIQHYALNRLVHFYHFLGL